LDQFKKDAKIDPYEIKFRGLSKEEKQNLLDQMTDEEVEKYKKYVHE